MCRNKLARCCVHRPGIAGRGATIQRRVILTRRTYSSVSFCDIYQDIDIDESDILGGEARAYGHIGHPHHVFISYKSRAQPAPV